jgi:hypothetical protein
MLLTPGVLAQQSPPASETESAPQEGAEGQPAEGPAGEEGAPTSDVPDAIELVEGTGYNYDSRGRRDPFISLALGMNILSPEVRPPGLGGMLIQEVTLRGLVKTSEGFIAMIQGTDNKSYFAREGERMYDGTIESIDSEKVVFRQEINDPLRIEKFQRLEKWLHPLEEGQ